MKRVLVTGATGFVGNVLCTTLAQRGYVVRATLRREGPIPACVGEKVIVGDIGPGTDWSEALAGIDLVIHAAARVHVLNDAADSAGEYLRTNGHGTRRLALDAAHAGVRRFVYLSSVKVNGEQTIGTAFTAQDAPSPQDAYGSSKALGERFVTEIGTQTRMEVAIVRPPLVYGPGVRANFRRLLSWVDRGWPLPLDSVHNRRSLVSVWNLCDLLLRVLEHPEASGGTWMVSDDEDLSTPELVRRIATAMGRKARLLPVPVGLLRLAARLLLRRAEMERLCGSLAVDVSQTRNRLAWAPPLTTDDALRRTVAWYLSEQNSAAGRG